MMTNYDKIFHILLNVVPSRQSVLSAKLKIKNLKYYSFTIVFNQVFGLGINYLS